MSNLQSRTVYILSALLLFVLLGGPQMAQAWQAPQQQQSSSTQQQGVTSNTGTSESPQALPNAPSTQQDQSTTKKGNAPVGAAAAEAGVTAGGAASRPAGAAIAPAKQGQKRSLLIKLGLIAAAGGAIGAVYALSRGTGSLPPGATH